MDEYTFIAEDHQAVAQIENTPAVQTVSAEQLYKNELVQELQVMSWHATELCTHQCCSAQPVTCNAACGMPTDFGMVCCMPLFSCFDRHDCLYNWPMQACSASGTCHACCVLSVVLIELL